MAGIKASKTDVLERLDESIRYCNSHNDSVQAIFEAMVDEQINPLSRPEDHDRRNKEMKSLFPVVLATNAKGFIPTISMKEEELGLDPHQYLEMWFTRWVAKYVKAWDTLPSENIAKPKGAATDYALIKMVAAHAGSEEEAKEWVSVHNLFMSAENVGGNLLEEYIASKVAPYGWIWCRGQILTAVDFCNMECTRFIQIKNKSNTENSSGKGFREDRKAPSWFRMYAEKKKGEVITRWPELVEIIKAGAGEKACNIPNDLLSEDGYMKFIEDASRNNPRLITSEEK